MKELIVIILLLSAYTTKAIDRKPAVMGQPTDVKEIK